MTSTFLLNGIDLDNNTFGAVLLRSSAPKGGVSPRTVSLPGGGADGFTEIDAPEDAPILSIAVEVPDAGTATLLMLLRSRPLTLEHDGHEARVELVGASPNHLFASTEYTCLFRFNKMFWREPTLETTDPLTLTTASVALEVLEGLQAPVRDAIIRVKGGASGLRVEDAGGSFVEYTQAIPVGEYVRIETETGRAFHTVTDTWTGGTEVTGFLDYGSGPYPLEITPDITDITTPVGSLTVITSSRTSSPTVEVRGARAYPV